MAFKELKPEEWFTEIETGLDFRRQFGLEDQWTDLEALFYNVHKSNAHEGPNLIASTGDSLVSTLSVPSPYISVKPASEDTVETARVLEVVDNHMLRELDLRRETERAILHAYLWGRAVLKIGYDSEFGYDPKFDIGQQQSSGMTLTQFDRKGRAIEFGTGKIRPGMPWIKSVLPHDIVVPWGATELDDSPWVAHRVVRHIEDVKADVKYENTRNLGPMMTMEDFVHSYTAPKRSFRVGKEYFGKARDAVVSPSEYVELWEIHDRRTGKLYVISTGYDRFLRNDRDLLQLDGLPFVSISLRPNARSFWTTPDAFYLKKAQLELADISIQSAKQRRVSVPKILAQVGAISEEQMEAFLSPDVGGIIEIEGGFSPREAVQTFNVAPSQLVYQESEFTRRNARESVGFSRNQFGEFEQTGRRTATESSIVQQNSEIRMSRRHAKVRDLYLDTMRQVNAIIFQYWRAPRTVEIVGEDGAAKWVSFNGMRIKGEYRYDLGFSNEPVETRSDRRQLAIQLYGALSQDPLVNPTELRRYLMDAFNDPELGRVLVEPSGPGPLAQIGPGNAGLQLPVSGVRGGGGRSPAAGPARGASV